MNLGKIIFLIKNKVNCVCEKIERRESAKNFLYQRYHGDCQITCIGMILNWEYEQVKKAFDKKLSKILKSKMKCVDIIKFLKQNGKVINKYGQTRQKIEVFVDSLSKQTLLLVSDPYTHFVLFQNGKILDPERGVFDAKSYNLFKKVVYFIEIDQSMPEI